MSYLDRAIAIAVEAHKGQLDKADKPYILHPLRLMFKMKTEEEMIVAVLHDVVEDCERWDFERLESEGFNSEVIEALKLLTHNKKVSYDKYIEKIKTNRLALKVKIADLEDNLDIKRIAHPKFKDYVRLAHYMKYYNELNELV
jgi:(p)ppGpp synthase/HD superfamily hydrolase